MPVELLCRAIGRMTQQMDIEVFQILLMRVDLYIRKMLSSPDQNKNCIESLELRWTAILTWLRQPKWRKIRSHLRRKPSLIFSLPWPIFLFWRTRKFLWSVLEIFSRCWDTIYRSCVWFPSLWKISESINWKPPSYWQYLVGRSYDGVEKRLPDAFVQAYSIRLADSPVDSSVWFRVWVR